MAEYFFMAGILPTNIKWRRPEWAEGKTEWINSKPSWVGPTHYGGKVVDREDWNDNEAYRQGERQVWATQLWNQWATLVSNAGVEPQLVPVGFPDQIPHWFEPNMTPAVYQEGDDEDA